MGMDVEAEVGMQDIMGMIRQAMQFSHGLHSRDHPQSA